MNGGGPEQEILANLLQTMGRVEGAQSAIHRRLDDLNKWMSQLDERLRIVERRAAILAAVGGAVGMLAMRVLDKYLKGA